MPSPVEPGKWIRAVLFDLDGTLYRQGPLRALMAAELLGLALSGPRLARRRLGALQAYREAQEELRLSGHGASVAAQVQIAADRSGLPIADVGLLVDEWMQRRPLKYLKWCRASGLDAVLALLNKAAVPIGVFSDYPADAKLGALGLGGRFSPVLCSTYPAINAFKPNPRGFLTACDFWHLPPHEVLMVGDRVDVDGAGAAAAGMPCVIIGRPRADQGRTPGTHGTVVLPSFERLRDVFDDRG